MPYSAMIKLKINQSIEMMIFGLVMGLTGDMGDD